jgi:hypothetical protein
MRHHAPERRCRKRELADQLIRTRYAAVDAAINKCERIDSIDGSDAITPRQWLTRLDSHVRGRNCLPCALA